MSVKSWRARLGISQEELAERAGLHRTYICDVERGARNVTLESIDKLARALQISVPLLLSYADDFVAGGLVDVLYVEDLEDDIELTLRALKEANIANNIHVTRDGQEALDYLFGSIKGAQPTARPPQLILLDLGLPKISGLDVLRRLKGNPATREIPVVVLTASRRDNDLQISKQLGADAYLVKPVNFQNLSTVTPKLSLQWALVKSAPRYGPKPIRC